MSNKQNVIPTGATEGSGVEESLTDRECPNCENLKAENEEYKSGWQRAVADYSNLQKEIVNRRAEWARASEQQILEEFIPVYDNFKKAFAHKENMSEENGWKQWADGIGHIMRQFAEIFKQHNIEEIKTTGEKFDPNLHEAVGEEEEAGREQGTILREVAGGYAMNGKVIKSAKVIVNK